MAMPQGFEDFSALIVPRCGIYALYMDDVCVYVGRTVNLFQRLQEHYRKFAFNRIYFKPCRERELDSLEQRMIFELEPTRNKTHKRPQVRATPEQADFIRAMITRDGVAKTSHRNKP